MSMLVLTGQRGCSSVPTSYSLLPTPYSLFLARNRLAIRPQRANRLIDPLQDVVGLFGVFGLGAGLPWLAQISGGTIATSFVL